MKAVFWFLISIVFYVYIGYPFALALGAYLARKPTRRGNIFPLVSVIISAYNEERLIGKKIENCLSLKYPKNKLEIIIGSDGSTDGTNGIVQSYASKGVLLDYWPERVGKSAVLNRCVNRAKGEIILFSDADSVLEKDSLRKLVRNFADPSVGCVEGVRRDMDEKGLLLDSLYWKYETMLKKLNSEMRSLIGTTGAIYAIRKSLYKPIDLERGDDFEIPIRVLLQGYEAVLEPEALAYHPWLPNKDEFRRIIRIVSWMMPSAFILLAEAVKKKKWLLAWQLISHKILRWFIPLFMIITLAVNVCLKGGFYSLLLWLQVFFYFVAVIGFACERVKIPILSALKIPYFFCLINLASFIGIIKTVFGRSEMNWVKTARGNA